MSLFLLRLFGGVLVRDVPLPLLVAERFQLADYGVIVPATLPDSQARPLLGLIANGVGP